MGNMQPRVDPQVMLSGYSASNYRKRIWSEVLNAGTVDGVLQRLWHEFPDWEITCIQVSTGDDDALIYQTITKSPAWLLFDYVDGRYTNLEVYHHTKPVRGVPLNLESAPHLLFSVEEYHLQSDGIFAWVEIARLCDLGLAHAFLSALPRVRTYGAYQIRELRNSSLTPKRYHWV